MTAADLAPDAIEDLIARYEERATFVADSWILQLLQDRRRAWLESVEAVPRG